MSSMAFGIVVGLRMTIDSWMVVNQIPHTCKKLQEVDQRSRVTSVHWLVGNPLY